MARRLMGIILLLFILLLVGCESVETNTPTHTEESGTEALAPSEEILPEGVTTEEATDGEGTAKAPEFPFAPETDRSGIY